MTHRCPFKHPDGTQCKRCTRNKYEVTRHAKEDHKGTEIDSEWNKDIKEIPEDVGKQLQVQFEKEKRQATKGGKEVRRCTEERAATPWKSLRTQIKA